MRLAEIGQNKIGHPAVQREDDLKQERNKLFGPLHVFSIRITEILQALGFILFGCKDQKK